MQQLDWVHARPVPTRYQVPGPVCPAMHAYDALVGPVAIADGRVNCDASVLDIVRVQAGMVLNLVRADDTASVIVHAGHLLGQPFLLHANLAVLPELCKQLFEREAFFPQGRPVRFDGRQNDAVPVSQAGQLGNEALLVVHVADVDAAFILLVHQEQHGFKEPGLGILVPYILVLILGLLNIVADDEVGTHIVDVHTLQGTITPACKQYFVLSVLHKLILAKAVTLNDGLYLAVDLLEERAVDDRPNFTRTVGSILDVSVDNHYERALICHQGLGRGRTCNHCLGKSTRTDAYEVLNGRVGHGLEQFTVEIRDVQRQIRVALGQKELGMGIQQLSGLFHSALQDGFGRAGQVYGRIFDGFSLLSASG